MTQAQLDFLIRAKRSLNGKGAENSAVFCEKTAALPGGRVDNTSGHVGGSNTVKTSGERATTRLFTAKNDGAGSFMGEIGGTRSFLSEAGGIFSEHAEEKRPQIRSYAEGSLLYRAFWTGERLFAGEAFLYENSRPLWVMNFLGRIPDTAFSASFLQKALLMISPDAPYRGPSRFSEGDFTYFCNSAGEPDWFYGYEWITFGEKTVYEFAFHGGDIE